MSWTSFTLRGLVLVFLVSALLFLAELSLPLGALLVFLLALSVGLTWLIVNMLRDDDGVTDFFDNQKRG